MRALEIKATIYTAEKKWDHWNGAPLDNSY